MIDSIGPSIILWSIFFQPCIVVKCIYTDVFTIMLLFCTNNKKRIGRSKAAVLLLLIRC